MRYTLVVQYGARSRPLAGSPPGGQQMHQGLDETQARQALEAFARDLWRFHGSGIKSITITAEEKA